MNAKVYHVIKPTFTADETLPLSAYKLVAEVNSNNVDDVYSLTQNIDDDWTRNAEVTPLAGDRIRSTSVGDIVEFDGKFHLCESIGWSIVSFK